MALHERIFFTNMRSQFFIYLTIVAVFIENTSCFIRPYQKIEQVPVAGDPGEPLFLTPLIEEGRIEEAQLLSRVGNLTGAEDVISYSGYLTVNKEYNSNLFFWFFPAEVNNSTAPVVLWLQGGPGASSLLALFNEHGPFYITDGNILARRKYAWTITHSVLYIDNPVGTGFSFTDNDAGYARNQSDVGRDLYNALVQFFKLFPEIQGNDFFVTGESYAGKYVPAVSYTIHTENPMADLKINFKGMAIGNGLTDPENMLKYGDYLYQLGLIDAMARNQFHELEALGVEHIRAGEWDAAFDVFDQLLNGDLYKYGTLFYNVTGYTNYFNYLYNNPVPEADFGAYVQLEVVRQAIHVGNNSFHQGNDVEIHLKQDVMKSVKPWVEVLLENYRVLIYNGQLDIIVAYPLTENYLKTLIWSGSVEYQNATRYQWMVGSELAGYAKTAGFLTEVIVRNAGHMVPTDQPLWAYDLINRFTSNKPFRKNSKKNKNKF